jgi:hypothetical protein
MAHKLERIDGVLDGFFETGTEGVIWSVYADRTNPEFRSYNKLHRIKDGDRLIVYAPDNKTVVFDEVIDYDTHAGWRPYPMQTEGLPVYGQQVALGFWVHGVQRGMAPDDWARFFFPREWYGGPKADVPDLWATLYHAPRPTRKQ